MGLDMYLVAEGYFGKYANSFRDPDDHEERMSPKQYAETFEALAGLSWPKELELEAFHINTDAIYWRKANAIHKWFTDHCAGGVDECQKVPVCYEQLQQLYNLCLWLLVKKDNKLAAKYLPTTSGFFFGSTEYDDWYWENVEHTAKGLRNVLDHPGWCFDYHYHASW